MRIIFGLVFIAVAYCSVQAQGFKAQVVGRVLDPAGSPAAGTRLTVTNLETNLVSQTVANSSGEFVIGQLVPGRYRLTAERDGFKRIAVPAVVLEVDQTQRVDLQLEIGQLTAEVVIDDQPPALNVETSSLGSVITNREIVDIPLNGRNYLSLALLSAGVAPSAAGANPHNINGSRSDYVNYLIDGVANINRRGNEPVAMPSIDTIQEFKIITNSFSAEYGRLSGGVISVALKGGANDLHGTLFAFNRNDAFDARSFFDAATQKLNRNHFGGVISGPIARDQTFFLASFEGYRNRQGETRLTRVPTIDERNGIFSTAIRNPFTGQPFAGNRITPALLNPVALRLLDFFPLPNRTGVLNYTTFAKIRENQNNFLAKITHRLNDRHQFDGRVLINDVSGENPFRSTSIPGFGSVRETHKQHWSVGYTGALSDSLVNEARFGLSRDDFKESSVNAGKNTSADIGIAGVAPDYGLANIVVSGFPELGDATFLPDEWRDYEFSFSDTLSFSAGRHFLKVGGDYQHSRFSSLFASFAGGQIAFSGAFSLNALGDFLLGLPVQTQRQAGTNRSRLTSSYIGIFAQDDWRIHPRLTLNLGLRYDVNRPAVEADDKWANFIISERKQVSAGTEGLPRALVRTDYNNLSPRVGFAYRPFERGQTVIRGGYGVFHSFDLQFTQYQLMGASAFPFTRLELFQAAAVGNPNLAIPFPDRPASTPGALSPNGWEFENPTPYMQNWNLTAGHALRSNLSFELSYVGSKGTNLSSTANINQTVRTAAGNITPFPGFGRILFQRLRANSGYHALQLGVQKRLAGGFSFRSAVTWAKSIDNTSFGAPARLPQNPSDLQAERGLSDFDRRRTWTGDFVYEIPSGKNRRFGGALSKWLAALVGGWQLNGIILLYDGRPLTPVVSRANTQAGFASRPDRLASGMIDDPTVERWYDPSAFAVVPAGEFRFGNSGRNILIGPGGISLDASLLKKFRLPWKDQYLQLRAEIFNVANRANFGQPDARIDQPTAGIISTASPGRQIQFAVKYLF